MQETSDSNKKLPIQKVANTIDILISVPQAAKAERGRVSEGVENRMRKNAAEYVAKKLEKLTSDAVMREKTVATKIAAAEKPTGKRSKSDDYKDPNKTHKTEPKDQGSTDNKIPVLSSQSRGTARTSNWK